MNKTKQGELAKQLMTEYPTAGNLTLAKRLYRDYPDHFQTVEHARAIIRYYKGEIGPHGRKFMTDLTHVKDLDKVLRDKFSLPDAALMKREPYVIPKFNDKIIVFGDCHIPFQNKDAIYSALNQTAKKSANCIILNGDMVDLYQDSRFTKDGRKPNVEYELDLFYQFLSDLKDAFPNVLIIWKFGNHEERFDTYWRNNAPLHYGIGTESLDEHLCCNQMGIVVVKDKRKIVCGDIEILHGHEMGIGGGRVNPAYAMFTKARSNALVNHFHRSSSHKGNVLKGGLIRTWSLGAMCGPQEYCPYGDQDNSFGYLQVENGKTYVTNWEV